TSDGASRCPSPHDAPRGQRRLRGHAGRRTRLTGDVRLTAPGIEAGRDESGQAKRVGDRRLWPRQAVQAWTPAFEAAALPPRGPLVPEARALPCAVRSTACAERRLPGERRVRRGAEAGADAAPHHSD